MALLSFVLSVYVHKFVLESYVVNERAEVGFCKSFSSRHDEKDNIEAVIIIKKNILFIVFILIIIKLF